LEDGRRRRRLGLHPSHERLRRRARDEGQMGLQQAHLLRPTRQGGAEREDPRCPRRLGLVWAYP